MTTFESTLTGKAVVLTGAERGLGAAIPPASPDGEDVSYKVLGA